MDRALEERVWSRARDRCEYSRMPQAFDPVAFEIDHILAKQHHGQTIAENLALICFSCNRHKGPNIAGFGVESQRTVALYHPRRDVWEKYYMWRGAQLVGLSAAGRVTVHVLAINDELRLALRSELIDEGVFVP
jgi:hypothetical protein